MACTYSLVKGIRAEHSGIDGIHRCAYGTLDGSDDGNATNDWDNGASYSTNDWGNGASYSTYDWGNNTSYYGHWICQFA